MEKLDKKVEAEDARLAAEQEQLEEECGSAVDAARAKLEELAGDAAAFLEVGGDEVAEAEQAKTEVASKSRDLLSTAEECASKWHRHQELVDALQHDVSHLEELRALAYDKFSTMRKYLKERLHGAAAAELSDGDLAELRNRLKEMDGTPYAHARSAAKDKARREARARMYAPQAPNNHLEEELESTTKRVDKISGVDAVGEHNHRRDLNAAHSGSIKEQLGTLHDRMDALAAHVADAHAAHRAAHERLAARLRKMRAQPKGADVSGLEDALKLADSAVRQAREARKLARSAHRTSNSPEVHRNPMVATGATGPVESSAAAAPTGPAAGTGAEQANAVRIKAALRLDANVAGLEAEAVTKAVRKAVVRSLSSDIGVSEDSVAVMSVTDKNDEPVSDKTAGYGQVNVVFTVMVDAAGAKEAEQQLREAVEGENPALVSMTGFPTRTAVLVRLEAVPVARQEGPTATGGAGPFAEEPSLEEQLAEARTQLRSAKKRPHYVFAAEASLKKAQEKVVRARADRDRAIGNGESPVEEDAALKHAESGAEAARGAMQQSRDRWMAEVETAKERVQDLELQLLQRNVEEAQAHAGATEVDGQKKIVEKSLMQELERLRTSLHESEESLEAAKATHNEELKHTVEKRVRRVEKTIKETEAALASLDDAAPLPTGVTGSTGAAAEAVAARNRQLADEQMECDAQVAEAQAFADETRRDYEEGRVAIEEVRGAEQAAAIKDSKCKLLHTQADARARAQKAVTAEKEAIASNDLSLKRKSEGLKAEAESLNEAASRLSQKLAQITGRDVVADMDAAEAEEEEESDVEVPEAAVEYEVEFDQVFVEGHPDDSELGAAMVESDQLVEEARAAARERIRMEEEANKAHAEASILEQQAKEQAEAAEKMARVQRLAFQKLEEARMAAKEQEDEAESLAMQRQTVEAAVTKETAEKQKLESEVEALEAARKEADEKAKRQQVRSEELESVLSYVKNVLASQGTGASGATGLPEVGATGAAFADSPVAQAEVEDVTKSLEDVGAVDSGELEEEEQDVQAAAGALMETDTRKSGPGPENVQAYLEDYGLSSIAELPPVLAREAKAAREEALASALTAQAKAQEVAHKREAVEKKTRVLKARQTELAQKKAAESRAREQARRLREEAKQARQLAEEAEEKSTAMQESHRKLAAAAREHKEAHQELLAKVVAAESRVHKLRKELDEAVEQVKELAATVGAEVHISTVHVKPDQMTGATGGMATGGMFDDIRELEEDEKEKGSASGGDKKKRANDWFVNQRSLIDQLKAPLRRVQASLHEARGERRRAALVGFKDPERLREAERRVRKLERLEGDAKERLAHAERELREAAIKRLDAGGETRVRYLDEDTGMEVQPPQGGPAGWNGESNPPIYPSPEMDQAAACAYADQKKAFAAKAAKSAEEARDIGDMDTAKEYEALAAKALKDAANAGCGPKATGATGADGSSGSSRSGTASNKHATGPTGAAETVEHRMEVMTAKADKAAGRAVHAEQAANAARREALEAREEAKATAKRMEVQERRADAKREMALEEMRAAAEAAASGDEDARQKAMEKAEDLEAEAEALEEKDHGKEGDGIEIPAGPLARLHSVWEAEEAKTAEGQALSALKEAKAREVEAREGADRQREVFEEARAAAEKYRASGRKNAVVARREEKAKAGLAAAEAELRGRKNAAAEAQKAYEKATRASQHAHAEMRKATRDVDPLQGDYDKESQRDVKLMRVAALKAATLSHEVWGEVEDTRLQLHRSMESKIKSAIEHSRSLVNELIDESAKHASEWYRIMREARIEERRAQHAWKKHQLNEFAREAVEREANDVVQRVDRSVETAARYAKEAQGMARRTGSRYEELQRRMGRLEDMEKELKEMQDSIPKSTATGATGAAAAGSASPSTSPSASQSASPSASPSASQSPAQAASATGGPSAEDVQAQIRAEVQSQIAAAKASLSASGSASSGDAARTMPAQPQASAKEQEQQVIVVQNHTTVVHEKEVIREVEKDLPKDVVEAVKEKKVDLGEIGNKLLKLREAVEAAEAIVESDGGSAESAQLLHRAQSKFAAAKMMAARAMAAKQESASKAEDSKAAAEKLHLAKQELNEAKSELEELNAKLVNARSAKATAESDAEEKEATLAHVKSAHRMAVEEVKAMEDDASASGDAESRKATITRAEKEEAKVEATEREVERAQETERRLKERVNALEKKEQEARKKVESLEGKTETMRKEARVARMDYLTAEDKAKKETEKPLHEAFSDADREKATQRLSEAHTKVTESLQALKQSRATVADVERNVRETETAVEDKQKELDKAVQDGDQEGEASARRALEMAKHLVKKAKSAAAMAREEASRHEKEVAQREGDLEAARSSLALPRNEQAEKMAENAGAMATGATGGAGGNAGTAASEGGVGTNDGYVDGVSWDSYLPGERPEIGDSEQKKASKKARRNLRLSQERLDAVRTAVERFGMETQDKEDSLKEKKEVVKHAEAKLEKAKRGRKAAAVARDTMDGDRDASVAFQTAKGAEEAAERNLELVRKQLRDATLKARAMRSESQIAKHHLSMAQQHARYMRAVQDAAEAVAAEEEARSYAADVQQQLQSATEDSEDTATLQKDVESSIADLHKATARVKEAKTAEQQEAKAWKKAEYDGKCRVEDIVKEYLEWREVFLNGPKAAPEKEEEEAKATGATGVELPTLPKNVPDMDDSDLQGAIRAKKEADAAVQEAKSEVERLNEGQSQLELDVAQLRLQVANAFSQVAEGRVVLARARYSARATFLSRSHIAEVARKEAAEEVADEELEDATTSFIELAGEDEEEARKEPKVWSSFTFGCSSKKECGVRYQAARGSKAPAAPWAKSDGTYELQHLSLSGLSDLVTEFVQAAGAAAAEKEHRAKLETARAAEQYAKAQVSDAESTLQEKEAQRDEDASKCSALRTSLNQKNDKLSEAQASGDAAEERSVKRVIDDIMSRLEHCDRSGSSLNKEVEALAQSMGKLRADLEAAGKKTNAARSAHEDKRRFLADRVVALQEQVREAGEEVKARFAPKDAVKQPSVAPYKKAAEGDGAPRTARLASTALPAINAALGRDPVASAEVPVKYLTGYDKTYEDAEELCADSGMELCSADAMPKLLTAGYNPGCACGWMKEDQSAPQLPVHPDAHKKGCAPSDGVHKCFFAGKYSGAYCCAKAQKGGEDTPRKEGPVAAHPEPSGLVGKAATGMTEEQLQQKVQKLWKSVGLEGSTGATGAAGASGKGGLRGATGAAGVFGGSVAGSATGLASVMADMQQE